METLGQKHKNANKQISDYFPLRCFLGAFFKFSFARKRFVLFCGCAVLMTSFILLLTIVVNTFNFLGRKF